MSGINVGDVVGLKSGGPKMTVAEISEKDGEARCEWQSGDGKPHVNWYPFPVLTVVPPVRKITNTELGNRWRP